MKTLKVTLAILVLSLGTTNLFSQVSLDTVYKKSGKIMVVKVTEVLPDLVKYIFPNGKDSIIMGVDKDELKKIVFSNGMTQWFVTDMVNPEFYSSQHKSDLKIDFLAPLLNHTTIVYERSIKPGMSWETGVSILGLGVKPDGFNPVSGAIFGGGIKFIHTPNFSSRGQHYTHILKGDYFRIQGYLGYYSENYNQNLYTNSYPYSSTQINVHDKYSVSGLHIHFGEQYVMDDKFCLDIFGGFGYAFVGYSTDNPNKVGYYYDSHRDIYNYVFTRFGGTSILSVTAGIRLGFLF